MASDAKAMKAAVKDAMSFHSTRDQAIVSLLAKELWTSEPGVDHQELDARFTGEDSLSALQLIRPD